MDWLRWTAFYVLLDVLSMGSTDQTLADHQRQQALGNNSPRYGLFSCAALCEIGSPALQLSLSEQVADKPFRSLQRHGNRPQ